MLQVTNIQRKFLTRGGRGVNMNLLKHLKIKKHIVKGRIVKCIFFHSYPKINLGTTKLGVSLLSTM